MTPRQFLTRGLLLVAVAAPVAVPAYRKARDRANLRACWANQKTLAGAMEMYTLDH